MPGNVRARRVQHRALSHHIRPELGAHICTERRALLVAHNRAVGLADGAANGVAESLAHTISFSRALRCSLGRVDASTDTGADGGSDIAAHRRTLGCVDRCADDHAVGTLEQHTIGTTIGRADAITVVVAHVCAEHSAIGLANWQPDGGANHGGADDGGANGGADNADADGCSVDSEADRDPDD